jgi:hypothetical protein
LTCDPRTDSISVWASRLAAEAAGPAARLWVADNLADKATLRSNLVGDIGFVAAA